MSYFESHYKALPHVAAIERTGRRADRILVKGKGTGIARVSVKPTDSAFKVRFWSTCSRLFSFLHCSA